MYTIIDCNNFFVSCEKVFNPRLEGKPVCVLSNNDGCVVSRSQEAKDIGIPMGAPYFKYKDVIEKNNGVIFSANFSLYGDMSNRVMNTVARFTPDIEIYSIDEAFLSFDHIAKRDYTEYARDIRKTVLQHTGIPVSIGIAQTKTLSKVANKIAKKHKEFGGVFNLDAYPKDEQLAILNSVNVKDIWGIGRQFTKFLYSHQIHTAFDLISQSDRWIKTHMKSTGLYTVLELRGQECIQLEKTHRSKQNITSSRSFGKPVTTLNELNESVATYIARACHKLRLQNSVARGLLIYVTTNRFKDDFYARSAKCELPESCSYTPDFIKHGLKLLKQIYKPGYKYKKAGIILYNILPTKPSQLNLFTTYKNTQKKDRLMKACDTINLEWGDGTIQLAAQGIQQGWKDLREMRGQRYTTRWSELLTVMSGQ